MRAGHWIALPLRPTCTLRVRAYEQMGKPTFLFLTFWLIFLSHLSLGHCSMCLLFLVYQSSSALTSIFPTNFSLNMCLMKFLLAFHRMPPLSYWSVIPLYFPVLLYGFIHSFSPYPHLCPSHFVMFSLFPFSFPFTSILTAFPWKEMKNNEL